MQSPAEPVNGAFLCFQRGAAPLQGKVATQGDEKRRRKGFFSSVRGGYNESVGCIELPAYSQHTLQIDYVSDFTLCIQAFQIQTH
jgi:hypothetical protein